MRFFYYFLVNLLLDPYEENQPSFLHETQPQGYNAISGFKDISGLRFAIAYDSRPPLREKNPNKGVFTDIHSEFYTPILGSQYTFEKITFTWRHYIELFPKFFNITNREIIFAYRIVVQQTFGNVPFFQVRD